MVDPLDDAGLDHTGPLEEDALAEPAVFNELAVESPPLPPPAPEDSSRHPVFPVIVAAGLAIAVVLASTTDPQPVSAALSGPTVSAPVPGPTPSPASADPSADVKALRADLNGLTEKIKKVQGRLDALPKLTPTPDLAPLEAKIARATGAVEPLPKQVEALASRVGGLDKALAALGQEVTGLKDDVKRAGETPSASAKPSDASPSTGNPPAAAVAGADSEGLTQAAALFKAGKYKEADDRFKALTESSPEDARIWYYAALSHGLATNQWQGETLRRVNKGVERERAGTPAAARIDEDFAGLASPSAKTWLDFYRKTVKRPG